MHTGRSFFQSILWFSFGLVLNRIKYILISVIVIALGLLPLSVFYVSLHIANELAGFLNRLVSATYNRFLRREESLQTLSEIISASLTLAFLLSVVGVAVMLLLRKPLALLLGENTFSLSLFLLAFTLPFIVLTNQIIKTLSLLRKFREAVIFHYVIEAILVILAAYLSVVVRHDNIEGVLLFQIGASVASFLLALFLLYRAIPQLAFQIRQPLFRISSTVLINGGALLLGNLSELLIVGYFLGARKLGLYIALLVGPRLIFEIATNLLSMFIHTASSFAQDKEKVVLMSQRVVQLMVTISLPLVLFLIIYPQEVFHNILRIHIAIEALTVSLLTLAFFLRSMSWVVGQVLIVRKLQVWNMRSNVVISLFILSLLFLLTPRFGFLGAAAGLLFGAMAEMLLKLLLVYEAAHIHIFSPKSIDTLTIGAFFYLLNGVLFSMPFSRFLFYFPVAFAVSLLVCECIGRNDIALFKQKLGQGIIES